MKILSVCYIEGNPQWCANIQGCEFTWKLIMFPYKRWSKNVSLWKYKMLRVLRKKKDNYSIFVKPLGIFQWYAMTVNGSAYFSKKLLNSISGVWTFDVFEGKDWSWPGVFPINIIIWFPRTIWTRKILPCTVFMWKIKTLLLSERSLRILLQYEIDFISKQ